MSLRNFFSRNKEVKCDTPALRQLITEWTRNEYWEFENFADFLELVGVKTPVKLSQLDEEKHSFKCVTELNTEIGIELLIGDHHDFCSRIFITKGEKETCYVTNTNYNKGETVPKATLLYRKIKKSGKELFSGYSEFSCDHTLKFGDSHMLTIYIDEPKPNKYNQNKSEVLVLRNSENIENYLLGLDESLSVDAVYEKLMEFLNFSNENISNCECIGISYTEIIGEEKHVRAKISKAEGKMQEYAILENKETFHVFKDGNWNYLSDRGIKISYLEETKQYVFSIIGTDEESIITVNPSEIMNHVKEKISKLQQEFVK